MKMRRLYWAIVASVIGAALTGTPASAQNKVCNTALTTGSFTNIIVPSNAACTLGGIQVTGNVTVGSGATLIDKAFVAGSIAATGANSIQIKGGFVGKNIALSGTTAAVTIASSTITGNITIALTTGGMISIDDNGVGGNVFLNTNSVGLISIDGNSVNGYVFLNANTTTGPAPNDVLTNNTIGGNLRCTGNRPAPVEGTPKNTVGGSATGQCAGF